MQSLFDIMANKDFEQPPEVATIKQFVQRYFASDVGVILQQRHIIITTPSSALAGSLRMKLYELQEQLGGDRRLIIRISQ